MSKRTARKRHKELTNELGGVTLKILRANAAIGSGRRRLARLNARREEIVTAIKTEIPLGIVSVRPYGKTGRIIQIETMRPAMLAELIQIALKDQGKRIMIPHAVPGRCSYEIPAGKSYETSIHRRLNDLGCLLSEAQIKKLPQSRGEATVFISSAGKAQPFLKFPSSKKPYADGRGRSILQTQAGRRAVRYTEHLMPGCKVFMMAP